MLSKKEFYVLKYIKEAHCVLTQRDLAEQTGYSLGTISKVYNNLINKNFINANYQLLKKGIEELDEFRVNNAIILAAGMTNDANQISKNIPKGLYNVKGEVLIERIIQQLQDVGIKTIYIVVGFKMDQFFYLEEKYGVKLVANVHYMTRNNNASLYCVKEVLGNSYIIPNDVYFTENVFSLYEYHSYYALVHTAASSKEAFVKLDDNDRIRRVYKGGESGWVMLGHSYLTKDFTYHYVDWLQNVYNRYETKSLFWEEIFYPHLKEVSIWGRKYNKGVIYEFDELSELQGFDNQFFNNINPTIYDLICNIFNASRSEITDIKPEKENSTDILFKFKVRNDEFLFRYPSKESTGLIDYGIDAVHNKIAKDIGVDDSFVFEDKRGYRISMVCSFVNKLNKEECIKLLKTVKKEQIAVVHYFDYREQIEKLFELFDNNQKVRLSKFEDLKNRIFSLLTLVENDEWEKQFSHNNIASEKFKVFENNLVLVDWQFSGLNDIGYDIAALASIFSKDNELDEGIVSEFMTFSLDVKSHLFACQAISIYYKFLLGIYFSNNENEFSDYLYDNWKIMKIYVQKAENLYKQKQNKYLTNEEMKYVETKINESIISLNPLSGGVTNVTYEMIAESNKKYVVRIPGAGTNEYINRKDEMLNIAEINSLGIMPEVICADIKTGILIMKYLDDNQPCSMEDVHDQNALRRICELLFKVHTSKKVFNSEFDIVQNQKNYREHLKNLNGEIPKILKEQEHRMDMWMSYLFEKYPKELVTCHIDPKLNNFLKKGTKLYLIDWEYSGMADCYFELANFSLTNNLSLEEETKFLDCYCSVANIKLEREKFLLYKFATDYLWVYWHLIKCKQKNMVEYNEMSWKKRFKRALNILDELEKGRIV